MQDITSVGEDVDTVDGDVNWCSHYRKHEDSSKRIRIELPYDPGIALVWKDICTPMLIPELFTRYGKQPKCSWMN